MDGMDSDDRAQDLLLREALAPEVEAVERVVAGASALVRAGRVRGAASTPLPYGNSKNGGSSLRGAGSKPRLERYGVGRWLVAGGVSVAGLCLGLWLSASLPASARPLLISNQGDVFAVRDPHGAVRLLSTATLARAEPNPGITMLVLHGGGR